MARTDTALLLYADTARSADMLYFGRFSAPDPFIALGVRGKKIAVFNALEFGRARKTSGFDTDHTHRALVEKRRKQTERITATPNTGNEVIRQPPFVLQDLFLGLAANNGLKISHNHRIRVRPGNRTNNIEG